MESKDVVTASAVALGVPDIEAEMSTEIDNFLVLSLLSLLTDGEGFDVVMPAGSDHGFDNWRKLQKRCDP